MKYELSEMRHDVTTTSLFTSGLPPKLCTKSIRLSFLVTSGNPVSDLVSIS